VRVWSIEEHNLVREYNFHKGTWHPLSKSKQSLTAALDAALDIQWLNDDTFLSSGSDHRILIQSLHLPVPMRTLVGHKGEVNQIRLTRSRALVVSASDDAKAIVWAVAPYRDLDLSNSGGKPPPTFNWSEKVEEDSGLYNSTQSCVAVLSGHDQPISYVAWAPSRGKGHEQTVIAT